MLTSEPFSSVRITCAIGIPVCACGSITAGMVGKPLAGGNAIGCSVPRKLGLAHVWCKVIACYQGAAILDPGTDEVLRRVRAVL